MKGKFEILGFIAIAVSLLVIYFPGITPIYGMHNDYSLLSPGKGFFSFDETMHLALIGRPLGALLINIPFVTIYSFSDMIWWRWVDFGFMLVMLAVLGWMLVKIWNISRIWLALILFAIALLPVTTVYVLWICHLMPGFVTVLLALAAYYYFDQGRKENGRIVGRKRKNFVAAFVLFFAANAVYPPVALVVFALSFLHILYSSQLSKKELRKILIADTVFFIGAIGLFFVIEHYILHQFVVHYLNHGNELNGPDPRYKMAIGFNISVKLNLLWDILVTAISGPWYFSFWKFGALIWVGGVAAALLIKTVLRDSAVRKSESMSLIEKTLWGILFVLLVNVPLLLPVGVDKLFGFRVIFPTALMAIFLFFRNAQIASDALRRCGKKDFVLFALFLGMVVASMTVREALIRVSTNYHREFEFVRRTLQSCLPAKTDNYFIIPLEENEALVPRRMPFEYGLMIKTDTHLLPFVLEHLFNHQSKHIEGIFSRGRDYNPLERENNCVIDPRNSPYWHANN